MSKAKFAAAKELIDQQKYTEARSLLKTINHPTAKKWLQKLDQIDQPKRKTSIALVLITALAVIVVISHGYCHPFRRSTAPRIRCRRNGCKGQRTFFHHSDGPRHCASRDTSKSQCRWYQTLRDCNCAGRVPYPYTVSFHHADRHASTYRYTKPYRYPRAAHAFPSLILSHRPRCQLDNDGLLHYEIVFSTKLNYNTKSHRAFRTSQSGATLATGLTTPNASILSLNAALIMFILLGGAKVGGLVMGRIMGRVLPPLIVLVLLFLPALIIAQETPTPAPGSGATRFGDMAIEFGEMAPEGLLTDIQVGSVFQTAEGESVRAIRLSDNMVLMTVVGESGSTGDTLVVTAPPDVIVELSLGDLWDKVKGAARDAISAVADAVLDGGGSGGSGGGQNCSQTTEIEMDGRGGIKTIRVTQSCTPA